MNIHDHHKCILHINEDARCVVWEHKEFNEVVYDPSHEGKKPTLEECEAVLSIILDKNIIENEKVAEEVEIEAEKKKMIKDQAIKSLKDKGKKFKHH